MDTTKFVYVVIDDLKVANIINNKESLIALLCETDNPDIRTFYTLEGAEQFKKQYDDKAQNKSQQKVNTGIKKYRESQESPPKKSASTTTSHQATPKVNASQTDEEMAKSVEIGKVPGPQLINKEDIYYYYREKDEDMAAARAKINPSDCYILSFHGVARPGETGAASFEILTLDEDRIYFDKISGLNKATSNEAQYCGLIYGLMCAMSLGIKQLNVQGNSQLVIEQMTGGFKVSDTMRLFNKEAKSLVSKFSIVSFTQKKK